ncbi:MAG TPA: peptidylprolyl isomerase [Myxococcota bacterium]|nr:peptidylprolyl isomerase [Myxococcota bacterium]
MLGLLRKYSQSVIIYVLFGIIIIVFVFTFNMGGAGDSGCGQAGSSPASVLVELDGQNIDSSLLYMGLALTLDPPSPAKMFSPAGYQEEMMYRSTRFFRFKGEPGFMLYNQDPRQVASVKVRKVADDLIETILVSEVAQANGLRATPDEIRARVLKEFTDPSTGKFRKDSYQNFVRYGLRTTLGRFEDFVRREILRERMIEMITAPVVVTEREATEAAIRASNTRSYRYLEISPTLLAEAMQPTLAEAQEWLANNEAAAKKFFEDNEASYQIQTGYDISMLKKSAASKRMMAAFEDPETRQAMAAGRADAKLAAEALLAELEGAATGDRAATFERLAKASSDDSSTKDNGGRYQTALELATISALLDPAVANAISQMAPNEMTKVIEGDSGYYIVYLHGIRPAQARGFDDVKNSIALELLALERAKGKADSVANDALAKVQANAEMPMAEIAAQINSQFAPHNPVRFGETGDMPDMPTGLTTLVSWNPDDIPGIGNNPELAKKIRTLTIEKPVLPDIERVGDSQFIIRLESAVVPSGPDAEAIAKVKEELLPLKRQAVYHEWYAALKAKAAKDGNLVEKATLSKIVEEEVRARNEAIQSLISKGSD